MDALLAASPTADDDGRWEREQQEQEQEEEPDLPDAAAPRAPPPPRRGAAAKMPPRPTDAADISAMVAPPPRADSPDAMLLEGRDRVGALPTAAKGRATANHDDDDDAAQAAAAAAQAAAALLRQSQELLLGPRRPRPHKAWRRRYVKLLVVGDSGTGKTTLVRTLLSTPGEQLHVHDGSSTPALQFARDPESLCTTVAWRDEDDRVVWVYRVQDTPGYSDLELDPEGPEGGRAAHAAMIRRYVHAQNAAWLAREQSPDRALMPGGAEAAGGGSGVVGGVGALDGGEDEEDGADDPRVDLVLYALPPHRLRASDLRYMSELGKVAPLLPVVCKCDTMTIGEARRFRREVHERLVRGFGPAVPAGGAPLVGLAGKKKGASRRSSSGGGGGDLQHGGHPQQPQAYAVNVFQFDRDTLARAGLSAAAAAASGRGGAGAGGGNGGGGDGFAADPSIAASLSGPIPPFLVVASNDVNDEMGALEAPVFWPERRYAWGTAEAFNPEHSDLLFLRALLLKEGLEAIVRDKRRRYEKWRREQLTRPRYGRALRSFLVWTAAPVAAVLWWARDPAGVARAGRAAGKAGKAAGGAVVRGVSAAAAAAAAAAARKGRQGGGKKEQAAAAAPPAAAAAAAAAPPASAASAARGRFRGGRAAAVAATAPAPVAVEPAGDGRKRGPFGLW
jgi:septin family protein